MPSRKLVPGVMPTETAFPNPERYELQESKPKEDIVRNEEIGMWLDTALRNCQFRKMLLGRKYAFQMMLCAIKRAAS